MNLGFDEIDDIAVTIFDDDDGEQVQVIAEPADDEDLDGTQDPEVADPDEPEQDIDDDGDADDDDADPAAGESDKEPLTPQQRHAQANARRAKLDAQIYERAKADAQAELAAEREALYASLGLVDPFNDNKPVKTKEDYDAYIRARDENELKRALKNGTATPEMLYSAVDRRLSEREQPAAAAQADEQTPNLTELNRQYAMLTELEEDVPTLEELGQDTAFINALKETGHIVKAYRKMHEGQSIAAETARAVAQERQRNTGKDHLRRSGAARGSGGVEVSAETIAYYRRIDPNFTIEEIRASEENYAASKKGR